MTPAMAKAWVRHMRTDTTNLFADGLLLCVEWQTCLYCQEAVANAEVEAKAKAELQRIRWDCDANGSEVIT